MRGDYTLSNELDVLDSFLDVDHEQHFTNAFFGLLELGGVETFNAVFGHIVEFGVPPSLILNERVQRRIPDAILVTDEKLLMIEVKTGADQSGSTQLRDETQDLREASQDHKYLLYLTHHRKRPEIPNLDELVWNNWYDIDTQIQKAIEQPGSDTAILTLLHNILRLNGYIGFTTMDDNDLTTLINAYPARETVLEQVEALAISVTKQLAEQFEIRGPAFKRHLSNDDTVSGLQFCIFDTPDFHGNSDLSTKKKANQSYAFMLFDERAAKLTTGLTFRVNPTDSDADYKFDDEIQANWPQIIDLADSLDATVSTSKYWRRRGVHRDIQINPAQIHLNDSTCSNDLELLAPETRRINIYIEYDRDSLTEPSIKNDILVSFIEMLKLVEDLKG